MEELFPSWYHVKRYEEVLVFTCGLMSDPRPLIEHVGEMLVERETLKARGNDDVRETHLSTMGKSALLLNLIRSLYAEANMPLDSEPHHNEMFNFYSHEQDDMCGRPRDTTYIEIPSQLYVFECLQHHAPRCNIKKFGAIHKHCVVRINDVPSSVANSLLLTVRKISQNQPVTDLCIDSLHCDTSDAVPADVFNMTEATQSITIVDSTLPRDLMGHLISQLSQCKYLRKLHIANIWLCHFLPKQETKEEISDIKISDACSQAQNQVSITRQSQNFILSERLSIGEFIASEIRKWGDNHPLQQLILTNCLLSEDTCSFISQYKMLTHLNLNGNKVGNSGIHIAKTIQKVALDSPLQLLYLRDCSIPSKTLEEILKNLSLCRKLTHLDLGGNNVGRHAKHLVKFIRSFGIDPPLQKFLLPNCSLTEEKCTEMLKCLSKCKHLTHLHLSGNRVGKGGIHIVEMVERLGLDSPLQSLYLRNCSIPSDTLQEMLKKLKKCKQLTHLDLGGQSLEKAGENLVELIESFGLDPPLQQLHLPSCSIDLTETKCTEMLECLSKCRHLTHLQLSGNRVGKGGIHIVEMVEKLGLDSPLQSLYLRYCSIPSDTLQEILKKLKKCKKLTHLDLGGHSLENAGENLVELIESFGLDPPLQQLYLPSCSITEEKCTEMLKCLSKCRHLTHLILDGNRVGKGGIHIVEMIERLGLYSPLQSLYLRDCSIPSDTLQEILKKLKNCKQLTYLDLGRHSLENDGENLVELIESFGLDPPLQCFYLPNCSITEEKCTEMLKCLSKCRHLTHLNLDGNRVGKGGIHIVEIIERLGLDSPLQLLYLRDCSIPSNTLQEILTSLKKCKQLTYLDLGGHSLENTGENLVELIENFGLDPPLQCLYLPNCSITEEKCTKMLKCLCKCRDLTHLNLSGNRVGKGGIHIVEIIERLGLDSPLQSLYLRDCSIPSNTLQEILTSLKKCKQLTNLNLGGHSLENTGENLVELIESFGLDPPPQCLYLPSCLIPEEKCTKMLKCLSKCRHLTHLILDGNRVGKGGIHIVEMIERLGLDSPLQLLYLRDCSIPSDTLQEILKKLKKCKQLTNLDLGGHSLENTGEHLVELIESFGLDSPLQQLYLPSCSITEEKCTEMLKYLSKCRHLTHLILDGNRVGKGGIHIVRMIERLGLDSPLQLLYLRDCSIPSNTLQEILTSLKKCKQLTYLDLGRHSLENTGENLVELIQSFGVNPPLQELYLPSCSLTEEKCTEMLKYLSKCRHLTHLILDGNKVGKGGIHIVEMIERLALDSPLQLLYLRDCSIPSNTLQEILTSLKKCKQLAYLDLGGHSLENTGENLVELIESFGTDPPIQCLYLSNCSITEEKCTEMLKCLSKCRHLTHLNLDGNRVGKGGIHIVEIIERLGLDSPLQLLYLRDCSIPSNTLQEILTSLKKCKQLAYLDLSGQSLENTGENLVELIESFGLDPPLQCLYLPNCSITETKCTEMLKCLSKCRHLTHLNLDGNRVGKGGIHIVEMIERLGLDSPLQLLYLRDCSIPSNTLQEILTSLKKCKQLTYLDLSGQSLENTGENFVELIESFGLDPPLQSLYLPNCSITETKCTEMSL